MREVHLEVTSRSVYLFYFNRKDRGEIPPLGGDMVSLKQLVATSRPPTAVFAFVLTIISFRCFPETPWLLMVLTALSFACITASIMSYNDVVDCIRDLKKGKPF